MFAFWIPQSLWGTEQVNLELIKMFWDHTIQTGRWGLTGTGKHDMEMQIYFSLYHKKYLFKRIISKTRIYRMSQAAGGFQLWCEVSWNPHVKGPVLLQPPTAGLVRRSGTKSTLKIQKSIKAGSINKHRQRRCAHTADVSSQASGVT